MAGFSKVKVKGCYAQALLDGWEFAVSNPQVQFHLFQGSSNFNPFSCFFLIYFLKRESPPLTVLSGLILAA
jgi:hypothetical protein